MTGDERVRSTQTLGALARVCPARTSFVRSKEPLQRTKVSRSESWHRVGYKDASMAIISSVVKAVSSPKYVFLSRSLYATADMRRDSP
jgi:hypothetical protein